MQIKVLTVWEPWATLLVHGAKKIETRGWYTHHRGLLLIHAAKNRTWARRVFEIPDAGTIFQHLLSDCGIRSANDFRLGHIVGAVNVTSCPKVSKYTLPGFTTEKERFLGDYTEGRFMWLCEKPRAFAEPIPCAGRQGLWNLDADLIERVRAQLGGGGE